MLCVQHLPRDLHLGKLPVNPRGAVGRGARQDGFSARLHEKSPRLSCQVRLTEELNGIEVSIPDEMES
ncbi:unnamed protein product [Phytomonas sp. EM1]|nr:unnamed protein product [Phytomonas sp. EM1]|eukprot:CCW65522.1 unnamed protein product [Phytomonas sp. isolate EM1]